MDYEKPDICTFGKVPGFCVECDQGGDGEHLYYPTDCLICDICFEAVCIMHKKSVRGKICCPICYEEASWKYEVAKDMAYDMLDW